MKGRDRVYERHQQFFGDAKVFGGQVTVHRSLEGEQLLVLGSQYDSLEATNSVELSEGEAIALALADVPAAETHEVELMIAPKSGRYFYSVDSRADGLRHIHWIDAESGDVMRSYNALTSACDHHPGGIGFRGAQIDLAGLVKLDGSTYTLDTGRQVTRDLGSQKKPFYGTADSDSDGCYDTVDRESPGQGALVSAHVNVKAADDYFLSRGFNMVTEGGLSGITVWAHKDVNYVNAYWDGSKMVFGDGNGSSFRELVALDIAAHEYAHGVTDFTSDLIYQNESGALNESFSDIMGAVVEFQVDSLNSDWIMGEDAMYDGSGLRNMADPTTHGDPGHYCDRYQGTSDNGGVHWNSGISNKAFYLTSEAIGLATATDIFWDGYTGLSPDATFMDARGATIAAAGGAGTVNGDALAAAWDAVGVGPSITCETDPEPEPEPECTADDVSGCTDDGDSCTDTVCTAEGTCSHEDNGTCGATCVGNGTDPAGTSCTSGDSCCSGKCKGKPGGQTCR
jgi:Zn-dependent metalloprotease